MPISPISILVGGTLAAIGSAYVFKKFVYDPHLAPFVEALLAQHDPHYQHRAYNGDHYYNNNSPHTGGGRGGGPPRGRRAVPIPDSIATTSSRQHHRTCQPGAALRRRSMRRDSNEFGRERYTDGPDDAADIELEGMNKRRRSVDTLPVYEELAAFLTDDKRAERLWHKERVDGQVRQPSSSRNAPKPHGGPATIIPVVNLDVDDAQDGIGMPHTARNPAVPAHALARDGQDGAHLSAGPERQEYAQASTAFSILSLSQSQIDSPESPSATLASMHLQQQQQRSDHGLASSSDVSTGLEMSGMTAPSAWTSQMGLEASAGAGAGSGVGQLVEQAVADHDDIISLADTEDTVDDVFELRQADGFSSRAASPPLAVSSPSLSLFEPSSPFQSGATSPTGITDSQMLSDLGLSWVRSRSPVPTVPHSALARSNDHQPISLVLPSSPTALRRSGSSVVSLSESEGWDAGSDWDGLTEDHRI